MWKGIQETDAPKSYHLSTEQGDQSCTAHVTVVCMPLQIQPSLSISEVAQVTSCVKAAESLPHEAAVTSILHVRVLLQE